MSYRELAAGPALAPWVACAWERSGDGGAPVRVIPDGCIDIIWTEGVGAQVVGPNTTAFLVALERGVAVVGVRMRPGAGAALLGIDARELRDGRIALGALWRDDGPRLEHRLDAADGDRVGLLLTQVLRLTAVRAGEELGQAAVSAGYADQAHFSHDCRALAGTSPAAL